MVVDNGSGGFDGAVRSQAHRSTEKYDFIISDICSEEYLKILLAMLSAHFN
jgi:hypothetical protein